MITKQFLQYEFPNFNMHYAKFAGSNYFFLIKDALHFHITQSHDGEIHTLVTNESEVIQEFISKDSQITELLQTLKTLAKEYGFTGI